MLIKWTKKYIKEKVQKKWWPNKNYYSIRKWFDYIYPNIRWHQSYLFKNWKIYEEGHEYTWISLDFEENNKIYKILEEKKWFVKESIYNVLRNNSEMNLRNPFQRIWNSMDNKNILKYNGRNLKISDIPDINDFIEAIMVEYWDNRLICSWWREENEEFIKEKIWYENIYDFKWYIKYLFASKIWEQIMNIIKSHIVFKTISDTKLKEVEINLDTNGLINNTWYTGSYLINKMDKDKTFESVWKMNMYNSAWPKHYRKYLNRINRKKTKNMLHKAIINLEETRDCLGVDIPQYKKDASWYW